MRFIVTIFFLLTGSYAISQEGIPQKLRGVLGNRTLPAGTGAGASSNIRGTDKKDSLNIGFEHRDDSKDSITITWRYIDSVRLNFFDSSISDFNNYYSWSSLWQVLGNNGQPAYPIIHAPLMKAGWDAGFHAYDLYRFKLEESRFYKVNRPFTQLSYQLASGKEQMIKALHIQNPKPNFGFGFDYRLINAPGFFKSQNTNHNNIRLFSQYQGRRKRYASSLIIISNTIRASLNGGITADSVLSDPDKKKRFSVPVVLGGTNSFQTNPFSTVVNTGNIHKEATLFFRQSYDIGQKDSIEINDSTTEYLFYPRLRFQHSITYSSYQYSFRDIRADSAWYKQNYDTALRYNNNILDTFEVADRWKVLENDFSVLTFPDAKNPAQFLLLGATLQNIRGEFFRSSRSFYNIRAHAEYRNKTRNKRWDMLLKGDLFLNGFNSGDYHVSGYLERLSGSKWGTIRLSFANTNRTPSFVFDNTSSFNFKNSSGFKKENILMLGADAYNSFVQLGFRNYLINNLAYFNGFYQKEQYSRLINLLQITASKKIRLNRKWNLYSELAVQQTDGSAPIRVPLIFTRNRLAFEGVYYRNLNLSTGLEVRYNTPFKSYTYSPVVGQFTPQDSVRLNNLPDINLFLHFRIKSFSAFIRAENLNTFTFSGAGGFTNNNFAAPLYPTPGFMFRLGIRWGFVN